MSFDFRYTCGEIDNEIEAFEIYIKETLAEFAEEIGKEYFTEEKNDDEILQIVKDTSEQVYEQSLEYFETVRKLNEEMREAAVDQLEDLEEDKDAVEEEVSDLKDQIQDLENELTSLQEKIDDYDHDIISLRDDLEYYKNRVEELEEND